MKRLWEAIKNGYLRIIEPVADFLVRRRVSPNAITTFGTVCSMAGGVIYALGHIMTAGWLLSITALFDVLDGTVARRTGRSTIFGAFYDSTLDRVADGFVLGGLVVFYAFNRQTVLPGLNAHNTGGLMVIIGLLGIIGTFLTSYTRARAESLGIDAKVGFLQRPERVTLLAAPQALFGLTLHGWVLVAIVTLLAVSAWITAVQRIAYVYTVTSRADRAEATARASGEVGTPATLGAIAPARPILKGDIRP
jgi:CDP-diacylglycerol--glycerol-3-phosphate 3-phosphatidyltransferase